MKSVFDFKEPGPFGRQISTDKPWRYMVFIEIFEDLG